MNPIKLITRSVLLLLVALCTCSCAKYTFEKEGYIVVRNRLRLCSMPMAYPSSNGVIRIAAEKGRLPAELIIHGFNVASGSITFHGKDGFMQLLDGNRLEVRKDGHKTQAFTLSAPTVVMNLIDSQYFDSKQSMQFQRVILPSQAQALEENVGKSLYWRMSPSLISSYTNGFYLISIPYVVSSDFHGDMGKAALESNWYDF